MRRKLRAYIVAIPVFVLCAIVMAYCMYSIKSNMSDSSKKAQGNETVQNNEPHMVPDSEETTVKKEPEEGTPSGIQNDRLSLMPEGYDICFYGDVDADQKNENSNYTYEFYIKQKNVYCIEGSEYSGFICYSNELNDEQYNEVIAEYKRIYDIAKSGKHDACYIDDNNLLHFSDTDTLNYFTQAARHVES